MSLSTTGPLVLLGVVFLTRPHCLTSEKTTEETKSLLRNRHVSTLLLGVQSVGKITVMTRFCPLVINRKTMSDRYTRTLVQTGVTGVD